MHAGRKDYIASSRDTERSVAQRLDALAPFTYVPPRALNRALHTTPPGKLHCKVDLPILHRADVPFRLIGIASLERSTSLVIQYPTSRDGKINLVKIIVLSGDNNDTSVVSTQNY